MRVARSPCPVWSYEEKVYTEATKRGDECLDVAYRLFACEQYVQIVSHGLIGKACFALL